MQHDDAAMAQRFYDAFAQHYDRFYESIDYPAWAGIIQSYLDRVIPPPRVILKAGCGTGSILKEMSAQPNKIYIGIDISRGMLDVCLKKNIENSNARLAQCNILKLGFQEKIFDAVLCVFSLLNLYSRQNRMAMLQEIWRVLQPCGIFVSDFAALDYYHWLRATAIEQQYAEPEFVIDQKFLTEDMIERTITAGGHNAKQRLHFFDDAEIKAELDAAGFEVLKVAPLLQDGSKTSNNRRIIIAQKLDESMG